MPTRTPEEILKTTFGYHQFKPFQAQIITHVLNKQDTLVIMPTGGGKSICYQVPALIFNGLTVVVSPLIALMNDQVEQLHQLGVPALFLNSTLTADEYQHNMQQVRSGQIKLLYVAPETLLTPRIFNLLSSVQVDCFAIDEAHCISEWGHDFRPEYRQLVDVRRRFPQAVCLALTATATLRVRADIKTSLGFAASGEIIASFDRPNLFLEVEPKTDPQSQALAFLSRFKNQSGIIYCFSRRQVDELSSLLASHGYSVRPYHAGLEDIDRHRNQEAFIRDDVQIMVATIAFGMGINKPNVRFVLHYDLPKSIESYYQEIGRAGRDGLPATCCLLYTYADAAKIRYFIGQKEDSERRVALEHLGALTRYAEDTTHCRRTLILQYFGEKSPTETCPNCDNCGAEQPTLQDITIPAQKFLSCVKRTGETFGAGHVADVLLGATNEKVQRHEHQNLSTYAIGKELDRAQWIHLSGQLINMGLLAVESEHQTLSLTPQAYAVLKTRQTIMGVLEQPKRSPRSERKAALAAYNQELFDLLRQKRKELADAANVPPYVIFSDLSLAEMATHFPQTGAGLLEINGVGKVKSERYGDIFLSIIKDYCQKRNIRPNPKLEPTRPKTDANRRYMAVALAYNNGRSIKSLMDEYQIQADTILNHLARFVMAGNKLRSNTDLLALSALPAQIQAQVFKAFDEVGVDFMRPVFDYLHGAVSYEELKILRLCYLCRPQA